MARQAAKGRKKRVENPRKSPGRSPEPIIRYKDIVHQEKDYKND